VIKLKPWLSASFPDNNTLVAREKTIEKKRKGEMVVKTNIFREYDIRGVVHDELNKKIIW
jgi:hypothetical protein